MIHVTSAGIVGWVFTIALLTVVNIFLMKTNWELLNRLDALIDAFVGLRDEIKKASKRNRRGAVGLQDVGREDLGRYGQEEEGAQSP